MKKNLKIAVAAFGVLGMLGVTTLAIAGERPGHNGNKMAETWGSLKCRYNPNCHLPPQLPADDNKNSG